MNAMWEQALEVEVAYRTELLRDAARPRTSRTARTARTARPRSDHAAVRGDGRRWGLPGSRSWLAAR